MTQAKNWQAILDGKTLVSSDGKEVSLACDGTARTNGDLANRSWNLASLTWTIKPDEQVYFYRYEKLVDNNQIAITDYLTEDKAETNNVTKDRGWRKILSSKRTWDE